MRTLAFDIGGANLKAASNDGWATSVSFPLWQRPDDLADALRDLVDAERADCIAVTMTGELADGYRSKKEGVARILDDVCRVFGNDVVVWQTSGEFVDPTTANEYWELTAAANWHALATWSGRLCPGGCSLLIDIGSTTTDIIPLERGMPVSEGRTDTTRLQAGELVYTGVRRTPLCAISSRVTCDGRVTPVAAELFATSADAWLLNGAHVEDASCLATADGRPFTIDHSRQRVARMVCADASELSDVMVDQLAGQFAEAQVQLVNNSLSQVLARRERATPEAVLISGEGEFLTRRVLSLQPALANATLVSLADIVSEEQSDSACAYALAQLAAERL